MVENYPPPPPCNIDIDVNWNNLWFIIIVEYLNNTWITNHPYMSGVNI